MTHRVSKGGSLRIDRRFNGVGRIAIASRTTNRQRFRASNSMLEELFEDGRLDILRAIRATHWKRACKACDAPELTLHDLRHFYGQSLVDAGRSEASIQQSLRHADPTMTRRYTKRKDQGENALAMDEILFPPASNKASKEA